MTEQFEKNVGSLLLKMLGQSTTTEKSRTIRNNYILLKELGLTGNGIDFNHNAKP